MEKDNEIDKLFRDGLNDPEIPFNELDWNKMQEKLDGRDKRKIFPFWLYTASGIAAALVICLFWLSSPENPVKDYKKNDVTQTRKPSSADKKEPTKNESSNSPVKPHSSNLAIRSDYISDRDNKENKIHSLTAEAKTPKVEENPTVVATDSVAPVTTPDIIAQNDQPSIETETSNKEKDNRPQLAIKEKRRAFTLSVIAAPDISTAKLNVDTKISTNFGLLATYALTNKISITTGAVYSRKLYNSAGIGYATGSYMKNAWQVNADCIVLDVPLNINYTFLKRGNYSMSINSGFSSYFMLNEKYKYINKPENGIQKISQIEVSNENQHIFGVANLSVNFERKITNSLSIGVQPFVKLPLTGIGHGDARLKSTGVAFSLNLGLFPKSADK